MMENPLANLGDLTKPATVLIEKISDAVGGIFKPFQIVRVAKAGAEAERIRAESKIQVTDLHRRAMQRFLEEEAKKQSNMEDITQKALPYLEEDSSPQDMGGDWLTNFFDKCRIISDGDMQVLWSRVLAGEANTPGVFSRKTVNLLADLDKEDAELFTSLCSFGWVVRDTLVPFIYDDHDDIYNTHGIDFDSLSHLESLGLIQFSKLAQFQLVSLPKTVSASYYGKSVELVFPKDAENGLDAGQALLTRAGQQLARVCGSKPVDGFFHLVHKRWTNRSLVLKSESEQSAPVTADSPAADR